MGKNSFYWRYFSLIQSIFKIWSKFKPTIYLGGPFRPPIPKCWSDSPYLKGLRNHIRKHFWPKIFLTPNFFLQKMQQVLSGVNFKTTWHCSWLSDPGANEGCCSQPKCQGALLIRRLEDNWKSKKFQCNLSWAWSSSGPSCSV